MKTKYDSLIITRADLKTHNCTRLGYADDGHMKYEGMQYVMRTVINANESCVHPYVYAM